MHVKLEYFRSCGSGVSIGIRTYRWIGGQEQPTIGKAGQWAGLASSSGQIEAYLLPALFVAAEQHPATVVERLGIPEGFQPAGKDAVANAYQAR
ncbi:MAG: hypothetical protein ACYST5_18300 [Planctomycetota bacterium]